MTIPPTEALSVDLGPISEPKMALAYDKEKGVQCTISFKANVDPHDVARIFDAGKSASLRAKIFTQALPSQPEPEGQQLSLGAMTDGAKAFPEPDPAAENESAP